MYCLKKNHLHLAHRDIGLFLLKNCLIINHKSIEIWPSATSLILFVMDVGNFECMTNKPHYLSDQLSYLMNAKCKKDPLKHIYI